MTEKHRHPRIAYLAPTKKGYAPIDSRYWETPMRVCRGEAEQGHASPLNYGHYFQGIADVLSQGGFSQLARAVSRVSGQAVLPSHIAEIRIVAEKHGSDYHPARIEVGVGDGCVSFVMNVAVTDRGKARLDNEYGVLQHLDSKYGYGLLPRVHFQGEALVRTPGGGTGQCGLVMFLADWLEGYHEFHLSLEDKTGREKLVLWEGNRRRYLSEAQTRQVYFEVARIMTLYYDVETFEQIFPWHHGAGDFVVNLQDDSVAVKLITARQYAPMIAQPDAVSIYDAWLLFLLNLSVRTRLDRLDGVGEIAWAGDLCVEATVEGFLEGLKIKERQGRNPRGLADAFVQHSACLAKADLSDMFYALVEACNSAAPDIPVIRAHLTRHIATFYQAFQKRQAFR